MNTQLTYLTNKFVLHSRTVFTPITDYVPYTSLLDTMFHKSVSPNIGQTWHINKLQDLNCFKQEDSCAQPPTELSVCFKTQVFMMKCSTLYSKVKALPTLRAFRADGSCLRSGQSGNQTEPWIQDKPTKSKALPVPK